MTGHKRDARPAPDQGVYGIAAAADWVFTGEGSVDAQTMLGKTPFGVAQIARRHNTPVIIFAGRVSADASILLDRGVNELIAVRPDGTRTEQALRDGPAALARVTAEACRRIRPSRA
jgi:glycerate kinase